VRRWRERRYRLFLEACGVQPSDRIIDVGAGWGALLERFNRTNPIVALDLFPVEPHYQLPVFQFLPRPVRQALNRRFTLGWQRKGHREEITLLSARDLERLFPDAGIRRERVLGLTKSLIAVRRQSELARNWFQSLRFERAHDELAAADSPRSTAARIFTRARCGSRLRPPARS
jgi:hypothetical protein